MNIPLKHGAGPEVAISFVLETGVDARALGIMAAAEYVAARLPYAWDMKGAILDKVVADIREALKPSGFLWRSTRRRSAGGGRPDRARFDGGHHWTGTRARTVVRDPVDEAMTEGPEFFRVHSPDSSRAETP